MNYIYLGDCHNVLKNEIADESVDLIYIDPPFNSKRDYNIFFDSKEIQTQRIAFEDTWTLTNIQDSLQELDTLQTHKLYTLLNTYQEVAPHAFPYLVMMGLRILELHRVLKSTGSFYLHCDPTMSHYLKTVCDVVFGVRNYRNEIVWKRKTGRGETNQKSNRFGVSTDIILYFAKTEKAELNSQFNFEADGYQDYVDKFFKHIDKNGRRFRIADLSSPSPRPNLIYEYKGYKPPKNGWAISKEKMIEWDRTDRLYFPKDKNGRIQRKRFFDELKGKPVQSLWDDIEPIGAQAQERLGYPTQKPKALLERIIKASSNEGDIVLDAFCGCGTSIDAAEGLHRKWIGIDISPFAISLIKKRLNDTYGEGKETGLSKFVVRGVPEDEPSAKKLWNENPYSFQDWWLTELGVFTTAQGADKGIDGIGQYLVGTNKSIRVAFQVKGGKVQSKDIDALIGVLSKHKCELGVFLTIESPTKPMLETATTEGFVEFAGYDKYPKIQILTLKDYFANKYLKLPATNTTFRTAELKGKKTKQIDLEL